MFERCKSIETAELDLIMYERINGKMRHTINFTRVQNTPFKVYILQEKPDKGLQISFNEQKSTKAQVKPNTFPWTTLNLDPYSKLMREDYHHSIYKSGFDFLVGVLKALTEKYAAEMDGMLKLESSFNYKGYSCYKLVVTNNSYRIKE